MDVNSFLKDAFLNRLYLVEEGYRVVSERFQRSWNVINTLYCAYQRINMEDELDWYIACYRAADEYNELYQIGIDNAFSTVLDFLGVTTYSADWYRVMAYHYEKQAARLEIEEGNV